MGKIVGDLIAVAFLAMTVATYILGWRGKARAHEELHQRNLRFSSDLQTVLERDPTLTEKEIERLYATADELESEDAKVLPKLSRRERHRWYREALKREGSGPESDCPVCGSSPWRPKLDDTRECCGNAEKPLAPRSATP
jgi:hypothetical protein